jgi:RNA-directed DNA polymerase
VYKKRGNTKKARKIFSPVGILKELQNLLTTFAENQFVSHPCSHGFVKERSTRTAAEQLKATPNISEKEITNIDVKGAFPAITGRVVRSLLRHKAKQRLTPWQVNVLSKIACNSSDALATGSPSSPVLFNWRLTSADYEMEYAFKKHGWTFIRYADDISVIHYRTQKKLAIQTVIGILNQFGLVIAREKLKTYHNDLKKIVGINLQSGELSIPRKIRRSMRALTHQLRTSGVISANRINKGLAYYNLQRIDRDLIRKKGTIEAAAAGFMAYIIHVERLLI